MWRRELTSSLREDDAQHIPEGRQRDEDAEGFLGRPAEDISEEGSGEDTARRQDLVFGNSGNWACGKQESANESARRPLRQRKNLQYAMLT